MEYGDLSAQADPKQRARDCLKRFTPLRFTRNVLPHELEYVELGQKITSLSLSLSLSLSPSPSPSPSHSSLISEMAERLLQNWSNYQTISRARSARLLLQLLAEKWELFGASLFYCKDKYSVLVPKNSTVWMAVHEKGVSMLNTANMVRKGLHIPVVKKFQNFENA